MATGRITPEYSAWQVAMAYWQCTAFPALCDSPSLSSPIAIYPAADGGSAALIVEHYSSGRLGTYMPSSIDELWRWGADLGWVDDVLVVDPDDFDYVSVVGIDCEELFEPGQPSGRRVPGRHGVIWRWWEGEPAPPELPVSTGTTLSNAVGVDPDSALDDLFERSAEMLMWSYSEGVPLLAWPSPIGNGLYVSISYGEHHPITVAGPPLSTAHVMKSVERIVRDTGAGGRDIERMQIDCY